MTASDFETDALVRPAVERQFEIIGEARGQLARSHPDVAGRIDDHARAVHR